MQRLNDKWLKQLEDAAREAAFLSVLRTASKEPIHKPWAKSFTKALPARFQASQRC